MIKTIQMQAARIIHKEYWLKMHMVQHCMFLHIYKRVIGRLRKQMAVLVPLYLTSSSLTFLSTHTGAVCICVSVCACVRTGEWVFLPCMSQGGGCSQRWRKGLLIQGVIACLLFSLWAFQRRLGVTGKLVTLGPWCCWSFKAVGNHRLRNST